MILVRSCPPMSAPDRSRAGFEGERRPKRLWLMASKFARALRRDGPSAGAYHVSGVRDRDDGCAPFLTSKRIEQWMAYRRIRTESPHAL
jgi:hypothetical protein